MKYRKIKELPPQLIDQIAAGEVITRPSSVVKELIENAIDAKATEITLTLDHGGKELIKIHDNGFGIDQNDLTIAMKRHTSSKIYSLKELECIQSLGFRGEALSSISSVSKVKIISKTDKSKHGWLIDNQNIKEPLPQAHSTGTTVLVESLFHNTPARRKFLKTERTEYLHIDKLLKKFLLYHFNVSMTLIHNGKIIKKFLIADTMEKKQKRIASICTDNFIKNALTINETKMDCKIQGWISKPQFSRSRGDLQHFYVNGRNIRDKLISHAIKQSYKNILHKLDYPSFILYFSIDPSDVDINVHPTKQELRFRNSHTVYDFLFSKINRTLENNKSNSTYQTIDINKNSNFVNKNDSTQVMQSMSEKNDDVKKNIISCSTQDIWLNAFKKNISPDTLMKNFDLPGYQKTISTSKTINLEKSSTASNYHSLGFAIGQLNGIYILSQTKKGLIIVDIHAAHERILYEKIKKIWLNKSVISQKLLIPLTFQMPPLLLNTLEVYHKLLYKLGFDFSTLGETTIAVREIPIYINDNNVSLLLYNIAKDLKTFGTSKQIENYLHQITATISCHKAFRANEKLSISEMNYLLRTMEKTHRSDRCCHGRPSWIEINMLELDKLFMRGK